MSNLIVHPPPHWQELAHLTKDRPDGTWQVRYATVSPASSNLTGNTLLACHTDTARQHLAGGHHRLSEARSTTDRNIINPQVRPGEQLRQQVPDVNTACQVPDFNTARYITSDTNL